MNATAEHYAKEAQRLLTDDVLAEAMTGVRLAAMVRLTELDPKPENIDEIRKQQAIANCLDAVVDALKAHILAAGGMSGGLDPNQPTSES